MKIPYLPLSHRWEISWGGIAIPQFLRSRGLNGRGSLFGVLHGLPTSPICVSGTIEFPSYSSGSVKDQVLQGEVDKDDGERCLGTGGLSRSRAEGDWGREVEVNSCDRLTEPEWACHSYQVLHGNSLIGTGVDQKVGHHVLN